MTMGTGGIFGNPTRRRGNLPFPVNAGTFPGAPTLPGMDGAPSGSPSPYEEPADKKPSFFGQGGAGRDIAGALGDYLLQMGGMRPMYAPVMQQRQQAAAEEQARQRHRAEAFEDWQAKQQWERANPAPSTAQPYRWEDNAGNVWERGQDGSNSRIFTDVVPKYYVQGDQAIQIANPYNTPQQASGPKAGEVHDGYRFKGGDPKDQNSWEPVAQASQGPQAFSQLQYQGLVNSLGQAGADAYLRRNNLTVGGY